MTDCLERAIKNDRLLFDLLAQSIWIVNETAVARLRPFYCDSAVKCNMSTEFPAIKSGLKLVESMFDWVNC